MRRRHFVSLLGTALVGGCLSSDSPDTAPTLGQISVVNHGYRPHTVHVLIERNGEPIYWADHSATAGDDIGLGGAVIPCAWGTEAGGYVVRARLDERTEWRAIDIDGYDSESIGLSLQIGDVNTGPRDAPRLTIWHTSNPSERCPTTTATAAATREFREPDAGELLSNTNTADPRRELPGTDD
ncbi:hypothetical protein ACOZ4B_07290 [Haloferax prahovense]|uniref:hypothetical protein n=1 Tax=Haloferax prahovense TaxID=381852 RepID=UPI003C7262F2